MKRTNVLLCERALMRLERTLSRPFERAYSWLSQKYWEDDPELEAWAAEYRAKYF